ncbi:glycosyltransferase [Microbulbifer celer]|uniref:Glycosyltransferase n=1 Tax=Microbulbifer celer TaxID=435905 RepID=A0ABW3U8W4_9GAMM|nr:glycosyltransferase [Microbulbifer celer]UFN57449.1 glycosyltransferase [Microbulbifer celer]
MSPSNNVSPSPSVTRAPSRLCHLFTSQETGGLEKHVLEQCCWQAINTDARVSVIAHPRYRGMFPDTVEFLPLNTDRSRRSLWLNLALLRLMRRHRFDVIHAHGGKPADLMKNLQRFLSAQVVITRHNTPNPKDKVARQFAHRIAVSERAVAGSELPWTIIPNGTALPEPTETPFEVPEPGKPAVISVARLVPAKGIDTLLRAWARAEVGDAVLYLLGEGPQRSELEALAAELKLGDSVQFVGYQASVADWYRAADLVVIASRYEGGPYTVAEALLAGTPVVSTDVGYVAENIPAQYLVDVEDIQTLAVRLTAALGDLELLRDAYSPYVARARSRLTLDTMAGETWRVYCHALGGSDKTVSVDG